MESQKMHLPNLIPHIRFSSVVVLDESNRVLLVCENKPNIQGLWNTPGGSDEASELPMQAAKRELLEETGIKDVELQFLETALWRGVNGDILMCHIFVARVDSSVQFAPLLTDEILEARWFTREGFYDLWDRQKLRNVHTKNFVETAWKYVNKNPL
jgi:8-oxo-dGTP pyrophosphatase MutT (NUDIX family)